MAVRSGGSVLLLGRLIGNAAFWCLVYTLFFKGTSIITAVVEKSPSLEFACFLALSCLPVWLVRSGWARWAVDVPLETIASAMRRGGKQHVVRSCIEPVHMLTSGLMLFFAVNFLAQSAPANFAVELPPHFVTLDPNGDGILTAGEFQTVVATFSTRLLHALSYFELGRFGFSALQKPEGYEAKGEALLDRYWNGIEMRTAVHVAAFLLMNGGLVLLTANGILRSLGLQPRSILAFGSVGGLAFGLASQNLVSNFMSGLLLIVTH
ncbi:unnamed protein product [Polarella glacialis]|uniref:EF-hand domain-containing protein n=1 Tax=Polarella glacialis TaxID=89957 RepID=A0A813GUY4_POLGL|nr:unnamed protein product [Polarella glacialis]